MAVPQTLVSVTMPSGYGSATLSYTQNNISQTTTCTAGNTATISADLGRVAITTQQAVCVSYLSTTSGVSITRTGWFNVSIQSPTNAVTITFRSPYTYNGTVSISSYGGFNTRKFINSWATNATTSSSPSYTTVTDASGSQSISTTFYRDNFGTSSSTVYRYWGEFRFKPRSPYGTPHHYFKPYVSSGTIDTAYFSFNNAVYKQLYIFNATTYYLTFYFQYYTSVDSFSDNTTLDHVRPILCESASNSEYRYFISEMGYYLGNSTSITYLPYWDAGATTTSVAQSVSATTGTVRDSENYYIATGSVVLSAANVPLFYKLVYDYNHQITISNVTSSTSTITSISVDHSARTITVNFRLRGPNANALLKASIYAYFFNF